MKETMLMEVLSHASILENCLGVGAEGFHFMSPLPKMADRGLERLKKGVLGFSSTNHHIYGANVRK